MRIYTTPLNTTIYVTSKSYGGIKLVWIWRISTWLKLSKYKNLTQNKIIILALMHNIRTHPFYSWYTLYTPTPSLTVKPINPPFHPFPDLSKPTLSKAWVAHYATCLESFSTIPCRYFSKWRLKIFWGGNHPPTFELWRLTLPPS